MSHDALAALTILLKHPEWRTDTLREHLSMIMEATGFEPGNIQGFTDLCLRQWNDLAIPDESKCKWENIASLLLNLGELETTFPATVAEARTALESIQDVLSLAPTGTSKF
jgi:hypothetical protein